MVLLFFLVYLCCYWWLRGSGWEAAHAAIAAAVCELVVYAVLTLVLVLWG